MSQRQFRVLYRDFLFGIVDRDLLSTYARGDASRLLLQIVALLAFVSICCSVPALAIQRAQAPLLFAWTIEHFLISTTMLVVGVLAVLSWHTMLPGERDVLVLGPLPIPAQTILLAKIAATAAAFGLTVFTLHVISGLVWPLAFNASHAMPAATGGLGAWVRLLAAYWTTMFAAGAFVLGLAITVQGVAAALLARRHFLRASAFLQLIAFVGIVGVYLLQPMAVRPGVGLAWYPSYWFLGLFQALSGSSPLAAARSALIGLTLTAVGTAVVYALVMPRVLSQIAEDPDIVPAPTRVRWLPPFGDAWNTAVVQFSIRTLGRSAPHRVILAFYWALGLAFTVVFLNTPRGRQLGTVEASDWRLSSVPLIVSTILMMACAVVAGRLAFAMPKDFRANWIFRVLPSDTASGVLSAHRRALLVLSAAPALFVSAILVLSMWPWYAAAGHLLVLALLGVVLVEVALKGTRKIPFTCSYLPGRSNTHMAVCVAVVVVLPVTIWVAGFERGALDDPSRYSVTVGFLCLAWIATRSWNSWLGRTTAVQTEFEDEPGERVQTLELWDTRTTAR
jgi:hypothetical protein